MQDKHEKLLKELTEQNRVYEENYSSYDVDRDVLPLIVELEQTIKIEEQEIVLSQYRKELGKALKEIEFLKDEVERLINIEKE